MKKIFVASLMLSSVLGVAQVNKRPITGAVFQQIVPDARAGGLADMGVATSGDAYSQYWNPAKYLFHKSYSGVAVSYTPWLNKISSDTFLLNITGFTYMGEEERSTLGASIYYFNMGKVENNILGPDGSFINQGSFKPNEFAIDLSYGLLLSDRLSTSVTGRYIRSKIYDNTQPIYNLKKAASTFAVDIAGFYQSAVWNGRSMDTKLRAGLMIKNIGPKLKYSDASDDDGTYLPTNFGVGVGYDMIFNEDNKLTLTTEYNKLLVPVAEATYNDLNLDGKITENEIKEDNIKRYEMPDDGVLQGMFSSISESASTVSVGAEYAFKDALFVRAGYKYGDEDKGDQSVVTAGAGMKFSDFQFDASYLIPTGDQDSPLANTLRFSLAWNFGGPVE